MWLLEVVQALQKSKVPYAVAGGFAVSLHGAVRGTLDIDVVISLKPRALKHAEEALTSLGLRSRIPVTYKEISQFRKEYVKKRNLVAWSFVDPSNPVHLVDILITDDIQDHETEKIIVHGVKVSILSKRSLIRMKKAAGRPQDLEDIRALEKLS